MVVLSQLPKKARRDYWGPCRDPDRRYNDLDGDTIASGPDVPEVWRVERLAQGESGVSEDPNELVDMAKSYFDYRGYKLPEGWRIHWVDSQNLEGDFAVVAYKFVIEDDKELMTRPAIEGKGHTINLAVDDLMRNAKSMFD